MKKFLFKIFLTAFILVMGAAAETISLNFVNVHDDAVSLLAILSSFGIVLAAAYCLYATWLPTIKQKQK